MRNSRQKADQLNENALCSKVHSASASNKVVIGLPKIPLADDTLAFVRAALELTSRQSALRVCVIYVRSALGDERALQRQVDLCRRFAANKGYEVVAEFRDTGSSDNLERPGLKDMLSYLRDHPTIVVANDISRLSRQIGDCAKILAELHESGSSLTTIE